MPSTPRGRKPRADAERNRAKVLEAARELFADRGDDVQMPEVARAAGVGVGTVYRHFPTRQALVEAAAEHRFAEILDFARAQCAGSADGLARYLRHVGEVLDVDQGLSASIEAVRRVGGSERHGQVRERLDAAVAGLVAEGRAAGALRADCTVSDVHMVVGGLSAIIRLGGDWQRFVEIALNGLRSR